MSIRTVILNDSPNCPKTDKGCDVNGNEISRRGEKGHYHFIEIIMKISFFIEKASFHSPFF